MEIREFQVSDTEPVIALWEECGLTRSWNDPARDIQRRLQVPDSLFLVALKEGKIIASVMGGYDGHRGWMNYLGVAVVHQRSGVAATLIKELESRLERLGCAKVNLQIRTDNIEVQQFYSSLGYSNDAVISMGKRLIPD